MAVLAQRTNCLCQPLPNPAFQASATQGEIGVMRTKNKIWIVSMLALVPALALAAFLAAGALTGGGGAPTAEAQSFSGITIEPPGDTCEGDVQEDDDVEGGPCTTRGDSLEVSLYTDGTAALNRRVYVTGGTDLPKVKTYSSSIGNQWNVYSTGTPSLGKVGLDSHILSFAAAEADRVTGLPPKRSQTITVTRDMANHRGDVYLFVYTDAPAGTPGTGSDLWNSDIFSRHFCTNGPNNTRQTTADPVTGPADCLGDDVYHNQLASSLDGDALFGIRVKFLGPPVVGMDGPDRNDIIEDFQQCVFGRTNTSGNFAPATTDKEGDTWDCDDQGGFQTPNHDERDDDDLDEIRSKLVAYVAESASGAGDANTAHVIDGSSAEIALGAGQNSVEVYAFVNDELDNYLLGAEVTFHVTSEPAGIVSSIRTEEAKSVVSTISATSPAATHISVPSAKRTLINNVKRRVSANNFNNAGKVSRQDDIYFDDAVALSTIGGLSDSPFRITVRVTADGVEIGTINVVRKGDPATIEAAIYPYDGCAAPSPRAPATPGQTHDVLNLKGDDCARDMRYGPGQMFVVDTAVKDKLGTSLSEETVSVKIDDAVLQKMTHGGATLTNPNVPNLTLPTFDVYTVKDDAALGMSSVTVSHSDDDVADVTLNFDVAGSAGRVQHLWPHNHCPRRGRCIHRHRHG